MEMRNRRTIEIDGYEMIADITDNDISVLIQQFITNYEEKKLIEAIESYHYRYAGIRKSFIDNKFYFFFMEKSNEVKE